MISTIHFFFPGNIHLTERIKLKLFIRNIFKKEGKKLKSITFIFCTDEYLLKLNQTFLNHNYYTDVITFNLSSSELIEGEIYISVDRIRDNSKKLDIKFQLELLRVMFHGVLHLCGYTDKKIAEKQKMEKMENKYLYNYSVFHVKRKTL